MRLIDEGALDGNTVGDLAEKLGVGPRHLSRLFRQHLNTTPIAAARTARIQRAKRLLDSTSIPMFEVASRAGFQSLRSFNAAFLKTYRRSPSSIRRAQKPGPI